MYVSKIPLDDASNINLNGIQDSAIVEDTIQNTSIEAVPATSLTVKARAGRLAALKVLTTSALDMRIGNVLYFGAKKRQSFEDVDAIAKQLIMHGNNFAAA